MCRENAFFLDEECVISALLLFHSLANGSYLCNISLENANKPLWKKTSAFQQKTVLCKCMANGKYVRDLLVPKITTIHWIRSQIMRAHTVPDLDRDNPAIFSKPSNIATQREFTTSKTQDDVIQSNGKLFSKSRDARHLNHCQNEENGKTVCVLL